MDAIDQAGLSGMKPFLTVLSQTIAGRVAGLTAGMAIVSLTKSEARTKVLAASMTDGLSPREMADGFGAALRQVVEFTAPGQSMAHLGALVEALADGYSREPDCHVYESLPSEEAVHPDA